MDSSSSFVVSSSSFVAWSSSFVVSSSSFVACSSSFVVSSSSTVACSSSLAASASRFASCSARWRRRYRETSVNVMPAPTTSPAAATSGAT